MHFGSKFTSFEAIRAACTPTGRELEEVVEEMHLDGRDVVKVEDRDNKKARDRTAERTVGNSMS